MRTSYSNERKNCSQQKIWEKNDDSVDPEIKFSIAQSTGAVEYTVCTSAVG